MQKTRVLFLCTGNSARSQMAEAFLRHYGGDRFEAYSAGLEPQGVHPYTIQVMSELGLDLSGQAAKHVRQYMGQMHFGYLVTVCSNAEAQCPTTFPGVGQRLHWSFDDPAAVQGSGEEKLLKFRQVRDQIEQRIKTWLAEQDGRMMIL
ncbi:MAG: arsenate reductase ArsC [Thermoflexales bacterium]|nr:arsenate reductase ArsC [Thermoflexales bacterium]